MNRLRILIAIIIILTITLSCEGMFGEFLEKAPGVDFTEDDVFSSKEQLDIYVAACYSQSLISPLPGHMYKSGSSSIQNNLTSNYVFYLCQTDEGEFPVEWYNSHRWNTGSALSNEYSNDDLWPARWAAIRMLNIMIARVDEVPTDETYKTQVKAEARFLRAQVYFDLFRLYGGMPIIDRVFNPDDTELMRVPRASVSDMVDFIIADCDYAVQNLPDRHPDNWRGRATKGAALALKARMLLYAASPQFNTATPILSMDDPANNKLICYGDYDVSRWQKAADAAKAVIDWAPTGGIRLITEFGPEKNYQYVWEQLDNDEIILADKHSNGRNLGNTVGGKQTIWAFILPRPFGGTQGPLATHTFIQNFYDKRDGNPQDWQDNGPDVSVIYDELEYRFKQSIGYQDGYWNQWYPKIQLFVGPPNGAHYVNNITGYYIKKNIPETLRRHGDAIPANWTWYRLAEAYLSYAEALNEAQGPVSAAYEAVNIVRNRSGMQDLPSGLTKDEFRERVRKERTVEFAFENFRFFDIRRWLIAHHDGVAAGPMLGLRIRRNTPLTNPPTYSYERYVFENRNFPLHYYFNVIRIAEVNKGILVQNPGW